MGIVSQRKLEENKIFLSEKVLVEDYQLCFRINVDLDVIFGLGDKNKVNEKGKVLLSSINDGRLVHFVVFSVVFIYSAYKRFKKIVSASLSVCRLVNFSSDFISTQMEEKKFSKLT